MEKKILSRKKKIRRSGYWKGRPVHSRLLTKVKQGWARPVLEYVTDILSNTPVDSCSVVMAGGGVYSEKLFGKRGRFSTLTARMKRPGLQHGIAKTVRWYQLAVVETPICQEGT